MQSSIRTSMGPYQLTFPAEEVQRLLDIISTKQL